MTGSDRIIPIMPLGAGSQPAQPGDENWDYLPLPADVQTYHAPPLPEPGERGAQTVQRLLRSVIAACDAAPNLTTDQATDLATDSGPAPTLAFPLGGLDADAHRLLAQLLGEGEVSARVALPDGATVQIQESRYAGVWRVVTQDATGAIRADQLEIGAIPSVLLDQAASAPAGLQIPPTQGHELMNAPSIASEIAAAHAQAVETGGAGSHAINFSLLPVTPGDLAWLDAMLGEGRIGLFSTGYGKCMVIATAWRHVWRVRYFDGAGKILMDALDITRIPDIVLAAPDDLADAMQHLREIVDWLEPS